MNMPIYEECSDIADWVSGQCYLTIQSLLVGNEWDDRYVLLIWAFQNDRMGQCGNEQFCQHTMMCYTGLFTTYLSFTDN